MLVCDQYCRYGQTEVANLTAGMTGTIRNQLVCVSQVRVEEDRSTIAGLTEQLEAAQLEMQVRQDFCIVGLPQCMDNITCRRYCR